MTELHHNCCADEATDTRQHMHYHSHQAEQCSCSTHDAATGTSVPAQEHQFEDKDIATVPGHWLLARLGRRVLRPGGLALTQAMLNRAHLDNADVCEFAPGIGRTAEEIIAHKPHSYVGIDRNADVVDIVNTIVRDYGEVHLANAQDTQLPAESVDVVVGEAILSMQSDEDKLAIMKEAFRVLRPGGHYALHELGLEPDSLDETIKNDIRTDVSRAIKVNARPATKHEWLALLEQAGFQFEWSEAAPMLLMEPERVIADEGKERARIIMHNMATIPGAKERVMEMKQTFGKYREYLRGIAFVVRKPL